MDEVNSAIPRPDAELGSSTVLGEYAARVNGLANRVAGVASQIRELRSRLTGPTPERDRTSSDVAAPSTDGAVGELGVTISAMVARVDDLEEEITFLWDQNLA